MSFLVDWWAATLKAERRARERAHDMRLVNPTGVPRDGAGFHMNALELQKRGVR